MSGLSHRRRFFALRTIAAAMAIVLVTEAAVPAALVAHSPAALSSEQGWGDILDARRFELESAMVLFLAAVSLAFKNPLITGLAFGLGMGLVFWSQANLFALALPVEQNLMAAWSMESLLEVDYQVRGAVARVPDFVAKLKEDERILTARRARALREENDARLTGDPARIQQRVNEVNIVTALLETVQRYIPEAERNEEALAAKGKLVLESFDALRRYIVTRNAAIKVTPPQPDNNSQEKDRIPPDLVAISGWSPLAIEQGMAFTKSLVEFLQAAQRFEAEMFKPKESPNTLNINGSIERRMFKPTADEQPRMEVENTSGNMVFFIRHVPKKEEPVRPGREWMPRTVARRGWMPIFPKGSTLNVSNKLATGVVPPREAGSATSTTSDAVTAIVLPSQIWFPVQPGDLFEARVATYGPLRQTVRWLPIKGKALRPDIDALRRSFYYLGYEQPIASQFSDQATRLYSVSESYFWSPFKKPWEKVTISSTEDKGELYGAPPWVTSFTPPSRIFDENGKKTEIKVTDDHMRWILPDTREELTALVDELKGQSPPALTATVRGSARFMHSVGGLRLAGKKPQAMPEDGQGTLSIRMTRW
jgi:hypothetical protein